MNETTSMKKTPLTKKLFAKLRHAIQCLVLIMTLAMGLQFYLFVLQAGGDQAIRVSRPESVEAFLPIGALMGWKHFFVTGIWDTIHPASMVFLMFAVCLSFLLRKAFCGWFCPVGTVSEWAWKLGESVFGRNFQIPTWADYPLRALKYLLLSFFVYIIFTMSLADIRDFFKSPYYTIADVKMLYFFTRMSLLTAVVLFALTVLSVFFRNFWCRYLCPYGALLGVIAMGGPARMSRNPDTCTRCEKCTNVCPSNLPVHKTIHTLSPECSGCMDCVDACPCPDTLSFKLMGVKKPISHMMAALCVVLLFWGLVFTAKVSGHWKSSLTDDDYRRWIKTAETTVIEHPSTRFSGKTR